MDFYKIKERSPKRGVVEIYPDFHVGKSKDIMIRGGKFYAIWDEEAGLWSTDEYDVQRLVDKDLWEYYERRKGAIDGSINVQTLESFSSASWIQFRKFATNISDNFHQLDEKLTFGNTKVKKTDYVSRRLGYSLQSGDYSSWDTIVGTLYTEKEREKIEWSIGAVVSGDSRDIQKFLVFYGEAGAGKSTILNIIQKLFDGYFVTFDAKALTSSNNAFSTEVFRSNPLVAIQHDGDLSRIEDNTKLNSIVSHEMMTMNEKYKSSYMSRANCFLFMATNRPVKITDAKSGVIRRLIDVKPSGKKIPPKRYFALMGQIDFELGAIANHCLEVYEKLGKNYYNSYVPTEMMFQTDAFFNFVEATFDFFDSHVDGVSLTQAYAEYDKYCDISATKFKMERYKFREELKNYFSEFFPITRVDGKQVRSFYKGFLSEKFLMDQNAPEEATPPPSLVMDQTKSLLDDILADSPAQLASGDKPTMKWADVKTKLSEIDTHKTHYVKPNLKNLVVIDFDIRDSDGKKNAEKNLEEASKWPPTYAEFSKSEAGIHLHYIYDGDVSQLSSIVSEGIEVKTFRGNASLRRKLTKCNNLPIRTINSGLPLKEAKPIINTKAVQSEIGLRRLIERNLNKDIFPNTKPSIDFINKILEEAYSSGMHYDITDMTQKILSFAMSSSNNADYCIKMVNNMKFKSEDPSESEKNAEDDPLIFFDIEVFPNLLLVNWKVDGDGNKCTRMINPTQEEVGNLFKYKLVGFNCRRYDNHILYAAYIGYSVDQIYDLSQKLINDGRGFFGEAYNISYTDVYDFASAGNKKSLKKWEIELGIHHQELGLPWDQEVPEELWPKVAEYCDNDVIATEAVFHHLKDDWAARQILADVAGMTVNDTTNSLTTKIIFGKNKNPQSSFNYRNMGKSEEAKLDIVLEDVDPEYTVFEEGKPIFPGYSFDSGKSTYRGEVVGEGGYVYAEPGMYLNIALLDISSMHPSSIVAEQLFGEEYTARFKEILDARLAAKHGDLETAKKYLDGKLVKYLTDKQSAKKLATALKTAINSVYGLTSAKFDNPFRDKRNIDNIVAKRGALFMINLKHEVQERGYTVAHIKTDSIKIPNATPEIISFVMEYGKAYGYSFEHEATYDRMCLVNDAVYIARFADKDACQKKYGYIPSDNYDDSGKWTATGAQFQQSYVFKTLFSKEPIEFKDLCETKTVTSAMYLDFNEALGEDEHDYHFVGKAGEFCPIKPGCGGGELLREKEGKYYAVGGTKGYRWMESEQVRLANKEDFIDHKYYHRLVNEAVEEIGKYGDFDIFVDEDQVVLEFLKYISPVHVECPETKPKDCEHCPHNENCEEGYVYYDSAETLFDKR